MPLLNGLHSSNHAPHDTIVDRFRDTARDAPTLTAVVGEDAQLTYGDLDDLSQALASHLITRGVARGTYVPFLVEKSALAIVVILGILRAGAAFVPLHHSHPPARKRSLVESCNATLAVCSFNYEADLASIASDKVVVSLDTLRALPCSSHSSLPMVRADQAAYVLFTSGTTVPKGVVVEHRNLMAVCDVFIKDFKLDRQSRVLQWASFVFGGIAHSKTVSKLIKLDMSMFDLFTLTVGGCLCMPTEQERHEDTEGAAERMRANWAFFTPSFLQLLDPKRMPTLKTVILGGEVLNTALLARWSPEVRLISVYGPTETTIIVSSTDVLDPTSEPDNIGRFRIGQAYIVDPNDHEKLISSEGVTSELLIGGPSVSAGYLNDPSRSAKAFISSPGWLPNKSTENRLYKTGDLVRRNSDGTLTILGRKDQQVKIHGQRVDLGEISHHVQANSRRLKHVLPYFHEQLRHSLVLFFITDQTAVHGRNHSSAVLDLSREDCTEVQYVQKTLKTLLPPHMVPTLFVHLNRIPLNAAGKPDQAQLQSMLQSLTTDQVHAFSMAESSEDYVEPETSTEKQLQDLWSSVLGIDPLDLSMTSHFVSIGGDSLKAMRLVSEGRRAGVPLSYSEVMTSSTLRELATTVDAKTSSPTLSPIVPPFSLMKNSSSTMRKVSQLCNVEVERIEDCMPCTPLQEGMVALSYRQPGSYISQNVFNVTSGTDIRLLQAAWEHMVEDVAVLRTRIPVLPSAGPIQVVVKEPVDWDYSDDLTSYLTGDREKGMLSGQPLCRFSLVRHVDSTYIVWTIHHALYDLFTMQICLERMADYFKNIDVPPLTPYRNFIAHLQDHSHDDSKEHWQALLSDATIPQWPAKPLFDVAEISHATYKLHLEDLSTPHTLSMYLKAAFAVALSVFADCSDVTFGLTASGRDTDMPGIESVAGPVLTTFPMRIDTDAELTIKQLLEAVAAQSNAAIPHQHFGLQSMQNLGSGSSVIPNLRSLLIIQPDLSARMSSGMDEMTIDIENSKEESVKSYPLTVECKIQNGSIVFQAEYYPSMINCAESFLECLGHVLGQLRGRDGSVEIRTMELCKPLPLSQAGALQKSEVSSSSIQDCIQNLTQQSALRSPKKQAVDGWDGSFTYEQLDQLSSKFAVILKSYGVGRESLVPICAEKSVWNIVAILGVLKAGAAFVPLDAETPRARHLEIVSGFLPCVVLVSKHQTKAWETITSHMVEVGPGCTDHARSEALALPTVLPSDLAYCLFTSGTTGKPKGVQIEHQAYIAGALARAPLIHRTSESRVFQFSSLSFDTAIEDIFTTLIVGGTVIVPSDADRKSNIAGAIKQYRATCADLTPSVANLFEPRQVPCLKTLIIGGEAPTKSLVEKWASINLINTYGPTECAIVSTVTKVRADDYLNIGTAPCGAAWVVSPHNADVLTPVGGVGELLMEGPMLSRGYLNNPIADEQAFEHDLTWAGKGRRFYRTGDLVRLNVDGSLSFVRRKDTSQVKLRGNRVELTEVEAKLLDTLLVIDASVTVADIDGRQTLIAFVVQEAAPTSDFVATPMTELLRKSIDDVNTRLKKTLPLYMVPAVIIPVSSLPTTTSGKRDRRALLAMIASMSAGELQSFNVSRSSVITSSDDADSPEEAVLRTYWAQALAIGSNSFSKTANFFTLGADSITAMRLCAIAREGGQELSVAEVFNNPTLQAMAPSLRTATLIHSAPEVKASRPFSLLGGWKSQSKVMAKLADLFPDDEVEDAYPCTPWQEGVLALSTRQEGAYIATHVFDLVPSVDLERLRQAVCALIQANTILRTTAVFLEDLGTFQVVLKDTDALAVIESADAVDHYSGTLKSGKALSLSAFAVIKGSTVKNASLIWQAHHAVFDGVTVQLLQEQLHRFYELEELPVVPYSRFVGALLDNDHADSKSYWETELKGFSSPGLLSTRPLAAEMPRKEWKFSVKVPIGDSGNPTKPPAGITSATAIRAAWSITLCAFLNAEEVVVGATLSGRDIDLPQIEKITGPCVTTVPVRVGLLNDESVHSFLARLQRQAVAMVEHQHFGLRHIGRLNPAACDFETILIVQPASSTYVGSEGERLILNSRSAASQSEAGYYTHPLVIEASLEASILSVQATYDGNKIESPLLESILDCFSHVLRQLYHALPTKLVQDLDLLGPRDAVKIRSWNDRTIDANTMIPFDLIARQARLQPTSLAIDAWDGRLTYRELDRISSLFAGRLLSMLEASSNKAGIIPICMERSVWTPVAMIAVQKAGFAYTALDPTHPTARLHAMCKQVEASILVADAQHAQRFKGAMTNVVSVDNGVMKEIQSQTLQAAANLPPVDSSDAAIVVFTSGSTGQPKAIVLQHFALATAVRDFGSRMDFSPSTRVLQNAAFAFDIHAAEIFLTLAHGGCLVVSDADKSRLASTIAKHEINWLFSTPSALKLLEGPEQIPSVKTLMMIGEAPSRTIYERWTSDGLHLINSYGPAENTLFTSMVSITDRHSDPRNIGRGISSCTWVVDPASAERVLPIGAVGELVLEGAQLASEYYGQESVTRKSFIIPSRLPLNLEMSARKRRWYTTGDLVQYLPDGTLLILGRKDAQTKLHGQRLELPEVEYHLVRFLPDYQVVADVLRSEGRETLVAFICDGRSDAVKDNLHFKTISGAEGALFVKAKASIAELLPAFMIPSEFIGVTRIPLTASGKLDRKTLHSEAVRVQDDLLAASSRGLAKKEPPTTKTQEILQTLWATVLNMQQDRIGIHDNFFALGGDSISAIQLTSLVAKDIPNSHPRVSDIFRWPSLVQFADHLKQDKHLKQDDQTVQQQRASHAFSLLKGDGNKNALLQELAQELNVSADDILDAYPCTPLQEGMLTASSQSPGAYVAEHSWMIPASMDVHRIEKAWRSVFDAFSILRTRIVSHGSFGMLQVVVRTDQAFSGFSTASAKYELSSFTLEEVAGGTKLTWKAHHALFDGFTLNSVFEQVQRAYEEQPLIQYVEFGQFISYISQRDTQESASFWRQQLLGASAVSFPDRKLDHVSSSIHERVTIEVAALPSSNITAANIVRAAWALVVARYSETEDVVFGETLSGRHFDMPNASNVLGPTVATVPTRVQAFGSQLVEDYLQAVQSMAISRMEHEHLGLQHIRKVSDDAALACEFQNLLVIQPRAETDHLASFMRPLEDNETSTKYHTLPLVIEVGLDRSSTKLEATFDNQSVSSTQMQRTLHHLACAIEQLTSAPPGHRLSDLDLLSASDKKEIKAWNATPAEVVEDCIHTWIKRQTDLRPHAQAVCSHDGDMTFTELDDLSDRLCRHLRRYGVGRGSIVPLCFEKSKWPMVAMMAVLKSGAAFAPTDPSHPPERLQDIVGQLTPKVILVDPSTAKIDFKTQAKKIVLTPGAPELDEISEVIPNDVLPSDLAYVIFTSGSTGSPKGVMISHGPFCSGVKPRDVALARSEKSRVLQFASFSFDTSLEDTLTTWMFGGCTCIPSEHERLNNLECAIQRMRVDCAHITPSLANALTPSSVPTLRQLRLGGERMTAGHLQTWTADPEFDLRNVYGPTECCITTSGTGRLAADADSSNVGFPVACTVWIVDPDNHDKLAPVGCVGEILVEGPIVAEGYLNNPEKTAESFITDPRWVLEFGGAHCRRFYKTGDVARYADNGSISFIGRKDTQVKLNGNRIETGDVETHLRVALPGYESAVEIITPDGANSTNVLAAYICLNDKYDGVATSMSEVSQKTKDNLARIIEGVPEKMRASLPMYMVPTAFIPLKSMPRSTAGKTDRKILKQLVKGLDAAQIRSFVSNDTIRRAPQSTLEIEMRDMWAMVLKLDPADVMATDSFISLGGDSILALRLVSTARAKGFTFSVADVLRSFSLASLVEKLAGIQSPGIARKASNTASQATALKGTEDDPLWNTIAERLSVNRDRIEHVERATGMQAEFLGQSTLKEKGFVNDFKFQFNGPVDMHRLEHACEVLISRHTALRTVFAFAHGSLYQVVLRHRVSAQPRLEVSRRGDISESCRAPAGLGGELVRFSLNHSSRPFLNISISHAIYDGPSHSLLCHELVKAYAGGVLEEPAGFASLCQSLPTDSSQSENYWRSVMNGATMTNVVTQEGPSHRNVIRDVYETSLDFSGSNLKTQGVTFASTLKAAWSLVLAQNSGREDVVFGQLVSTRELLPASAESCVGPCIEVCPVRVRIGSEATARSLVEAVQAQHIDSLEHSAFGFGNIVSRCTDWPRWTRFSSVVQHQNFEGAVEQVVFNEELQAEVAVHAVPSDTADLWVLSTPTGPETVDLKISYCRDVITPGLARMLASQLSTEIHRLLLGLSMERELGEKLSVSPKSALEAQRPLFPRPNPSTSPLKRVERTAVEHSAVVNDAWGHLTSEETQVEVDANMPFWHVSPVEHLVLAAVLSKAYRDKGFVVSVEAVLDAPSKGLQGRLLASLVE